MSKILLFYISFIVLLANVFAKISINSEGYYTNNGQLFIPVGVNYWPASSGLWMWSEWPLQEIEHDLDLVKQLGFNTVRFFTTWGDFEPTAGRYNATSFSRLSAFLNLCKQRNLYVTLSVFVGWMSGGTFWPTWKDGNLYTDPFVSARAFAFAKEIAETAAPYSDIILALEYGNEMTDLSDNYQATNTQIYSWLKQVTSIWTSTIPDVLVISGTDMNTFTSNSGWRLGQLPVNITSIHTYPVQSWNPLRFDGLGDPLVQSFIPFYVTVTKAFSPAMVQEFGTIVTGGITQQDTYIRAMLPASWSAGSNGYLWWCLRDIRSLKFPYSSNGLESMLGLVDSNDQVKPGLKFYVEFSKSLANMTIPKPPTDPIGIYFPVEFFPGEGNPGNVPSSLAASMQVSYYTLKQLGYDVIVVRGDIPFPSSVRTIIVPSAYLTLPEVINFSTWVKNGGSLIWNGLTKASWSYETVAFLGILQVDFRAPFTSSTNVFNSTYQFGTFLDGSKIQYSPTTAQVICSDNYDVPLFFQNSWGLGKVVSGIPAVEMGWASVSDDRSQRSSWMSWYSNILKLIGR